MFAIACLSLALVPPPVATLALDDPTRLAETLGQLLGTRVDVLPGRDLSAWRRGEVGFAALYGFDGLAGPTPPLALVLPMTEADFRAKALTDAERGTMPEGGSQFTDAGGTAWHVAAAGDWVVVTPRTRLLLARFGRAGIRGERGEGVRLDIDLDRVRRLAGSEITAAAQFANLVLTAGGPAWLKGFDPRQREVAAKLVGAAYRVIADGESLTLSARATAAGVALVADWRCRPGTPGANLLAAETPGELAAWRDLPLAYPLAVRRLSPAVARELAGLTREFVAAPGDAASAEAVADYERLMSRAPLVCEAGGVVAVADPRGERAAAHARALRSLQRGAAYRNLPLASVPAVTGAGDLARVRLKLDLGRAAGGVADPNLRQATLASIERLAGATPEYAFGIRNGRFVRVTGSEPAARLHRFTEPSATAGSAPELVAARTLLPGRLSALAAYRTPDLLRGLDGYLQSVGDAMPAFPGWELPRLGVPPDAPPAPLTGGLTLSPAGVTVSVGLQPGAAKVVCEAVRER